MKSFSSGSIERKLLSVPASDTICVYELGAGTQHKPIPLPEGAAVMLISAPVDVYLRFGGGDATVAVPSVEVTDGAASEVAFANSKLAFNVPDDASHLALLSAEAVKVTVAWYSE